MGLAARPRGHIVAILAASLLLDTPDGFQFTISSAENKQSINFRAALAASGCSLAVANFTESSSRLLI